MTRLISLLPQAVQTGDSESPMLRTKKLDFL